MQRAESRAVRVALVVRVSCLAFEVALALVVELFFTCGSCRGFRRDAQPYVVGGRHSAPAARFRRPASPLRDAAHVCAAQSATVAI
jgi:hypothetical protein